MPHTLRVLAKRLATPALPLLRAARPPVALCAAPSSCGQRAIYITDGWDDYYEPHPEGGAKRGVSNDALANSLFHLGEDLAQGLAGIRKEGGELKGKIADIKADIRATRWRLGVLLAAAVGGGASALLCVLVRLEREAARVDELLAIVRGIMEAVELERERGRKE